MTKFLRKLKQIFVSEKMNETVDKQQPDQVDSSGDQGKPFHLNEATLVDLIRRLEKTQEDAYSCEESYALLDEYVEMVATDEQAARLMPLVKNHMDGCPDCCEHFEVLLNILKSEASSS